MGHFKILNCSTKFWIFEFSIKFSIVELYLDRTIHICSYAELYMDRTIHICSYVELYMDRTIHICSYVEPYVDRTIHICSYVDVGPYVIFLPQNMERAVD